MGKRLQILGHRGAKGLVPFENTIESFQKAIEVGADGIEFDVRKTKDNKIVVHHDDNINQILIANIDYNKLLELSSKIGYKVPLLEDVLIAFKNRTYFDIELKELGYEEEVIRLILKYLNYHEFSVRSFNDQSIKKIKKINNNIRAGLLLGTNRPRLGFISRIFELFPGLRVLNTKCDFVSPYYQLIIFGFIARMHLIGKPVIAWTVNNQKVMKKLINKKIDGIVTDYPNVLYQILYNNKTSH